MPTPIRVEKGRFNGSRGSGATAPTRHPARHSGENTPAGSGPRPNFPKDMSPIVGVNGPVPQDLVDEYGIYREWSDEHRGYMTIAPGGQEMYCPDCDKTIDAVVHIDSIEVVSFESGKPGLKYEESGDQFCKDCGNDILGSSYDDYWDGRAEDAHVSLMMDR